MTTLAVKYANHAVAVVPTDRTDTSKIAGAIGRTPQEARQRWSDGRFEEAFGTTDELLQDEEALQRT